MIHDYNITNRHARDSRIVFEPESHRYIVDGALECDSVTTVISDCFEKFDADYWSRRKATPDCPAEKLKAMWEEKGRIARDKGTLMHERIERHYLGYEPDADALADPAFGQFLRFAERHRLTPFRSEWTVFMESCRIAGTLDFLAFDGSKFEIYDWKRSTKVVDEFGIPRVNSFGRHGLAPLTAVPDTVFHHYALQQSLYRYILAKEYGIDVAACHLGIFHPGNADFHVVAVPYLLEETKALVASRQNR